MLQIIELIKYTEQSALSLKPQILQIIAGIVAILTGLFLWLAGMNMRKLLLPLLIGLIAAAIIMALKKGTIDTRIAILILALIIMVSFQLAAYSNSIITKLLLAIIFSAAGTILIFTGQIFLLSYKGSQPAAFIEQKQPFFASVFTAMLAFGSVVQLLLCPTTKKKLEKKDKKM